MGGSNAALNNDDDSATESDDKTDSDSDSDSETETDEEFRNRYDTAPFREGEKVLAYHSLRIYKAKVLEFEKRSNCWHYHVHYLGWNKNWDEWIGVDRLMKFTEENRQKQEAFNKKMEEEKKAEISYYQERNSAGKKRKNDYISKLVKLSRTPNVEDILKMYLDYRCKKDGMFLQKNQNAIFLSTYHVAEEVETSTNKLR